MRLKARTDTNHTEIVDALRGVGATVQSLASVGSGCPDIIAGYHGHDYLIEIKSGKAKLTDDETTWHLTWRGKVYVARSIDDALAIVGAVEEAHS